MIQAKIIKGDRVIAHSIANTKPEAEADLLYQLMERIMFLSGLNIPTVTRQRSKANTNGTYTPYKSHTKAREPFNE